MKEGDTSRSFWRRLFLQASGILLFLAAGGFGGFRAYKKWEPGWLANKARTYSEKGDLNSAILLVRQAYRIDPGNIKVCRLIADITEKLNMPESLQWRQKVVEMQPGSTDDILACAENALRFGHPSIAEQTLSGVKDPAKQNARFFSIAGAAAGELGKLDQAETYFSQAARLEPASDIYEFNLANARLHSADPNTRQAARTALERLCESKSVRVVSLRALLGFLVANHETQAALIRSQELQADPNALFSDKVTYLDLLHQIYSTKWLSYLKQLESSAGKDAENAGRLVAWMETHGMAREAIDWSGTLPPEILSTGKAGAGLAVCYITVRDWSGLQALVQKANWGEFEYLRFMFLARSLREQGNREEFLNRWNFAVDEAAKQQNASQNLARIIATWGWEDELPDVLWKIAGNSTEAEWALQNLFRLYSAKGDTLGLLRVARRWMELKPDDSALKNNFAIYSLLLKTNSASSRAVAYELYTKEPANPVFASTYAFALHTQGRTEEALKIMNALKPEQLEAPSVAAYYGIILAATDDRASAAKFLDLAKNARLLPEEKELVMQAQSRLDTARP